MLPKIGEFWTTNPLNIADRCSEDFNVNLLAFCYDINGNFCSTNKTQYALIESYRLVEALDNEDSNYPVTFNKNDFLTIGTGKNAGYMVKLANGSNAPKIARLVKHDTVTEMLQVQFI